MQSRHWLWGKSCRLRIIHFFMTRKPRAHIFVCGAVTASGVQTCSCKSTAQAVEVLKQFQQEIKNRNLPDVVATGCECMSLCEHNPVVIIYPEATWYGHVDIASVGEVLDTLENCPPAAAFASKCSSCHH